MSDRFRRHRKLRGRKWERPWRTRYVLQWYNLTLTIDQTEPRLWTWTLEDRGDTLFTGQERTHRAAQNAAMTVGRALIEATHPSGLG